MEIPEIREALALGPDVLYLDPDSVGRSAAVRDSPEQVRSAFRELAVSLSSALENLDLLAGCAAWELRLMLAWCIREIGGAAVELPETPDGPDLLIEGALAIRVYGRASAATLEAARRDCARWSDRWCACAVFLEAPRVRRGAIIEAVIAAK